MNSVELVGRLTRDPDVRENVTSFTIALDREGKDAGADFPRVVAFGRTAEIVQKFFVKGRLVSVEGSIRTGSYQNRKGETVSTTDVQATKVKVLDWGTEKHSYDGAANKMAEEHQTPAPSDFEQIDDDVPF